MHSALGYAGTFRINLFCSIGPRLFDVSLHVRFWRAPPWSSPLLCGSNPGLGLFGSASMGIRPFYERALQRAQRSVRLASIGEM
jgi:hypothetical protein